MALNKELTPDGWVVDIPPLDLLSLQKGDARYTGGFVKEIRVGTFGDSYADVGSLRTGNLTLQEVSDLPLGTASTTTASGNRNNNKYQLQRYYPAARIVAIGGISGQTTTQMLARETLAASATRRSIQDVADTQPDLVILRGGSINDVLPLTAPISQTTIDAIYDRHMQIVSTLLSTGVRVLDEGIAGLDVPSANLTAQRSALAQLNARYAAAIGTMDANRIRFLSPVGVVCDATGAFLPSMSGDGTHLGTFGQTRMSQAEAKVLESWFGKSANSAYSGVNLLGSSALFPSVTSGATGNTPDGGFAWTVLNTVRSSADVRTVNGRRWAECDFTPTGATPKGVMNLPSGFAAAASPQIPIVVGGKYGFEVSVSVATLDGSPIRSLTRITSRLDMRNTGTGRMIIDNTPTADLSSAWTESRIEQQLVIPIWLSDIASADIGAASLWSVTWEIPDNQALRLGISSPRIVKLP